MEEQYEQCARKISASKGIEYPLSAQQMNDLIWNNYELVKPLLDLRRSIEDTVYKEESKNLSQSDDRFYSVFDAKLRGPFETQNEAFDFVRKNATKHPMQPITFCPSELMVDVVRVGAFFSSDMI